MYTPLQKQDCIKHFQVNWIVWR